jgi:hypothetical protein
LSLLFASRARYVTIKDVVVRAVCSIPVITSSFNKLDWIKKWTKARRHTFAERFIAFTAAETILSIKNFYIIRAFREELLSGLTTGENLFNKEKETRNPS